MAPQEMLSRIHIIGGPGSGKSYLAKRLAERIGVPSHDLDDLFWDNSAQFYGTKARPDVREEKLRQILKLPGWIVEGVYYQWVAESFRLADAIVVLTPSARLRDWRILKRFIMRKLGLTKGKRETIRGFIAFLQWNHSYDRDNLRRAMSVLEPHWHKVMSCRSASEAEMMLNNRSQQRAEGDTANG